MPPASSGAEVPTPAVLERGVLSVTPFVVNPLVLAPVESVAPRVSVLVTVVKPGVTKVLASVRVT